MIYDVFISYSKSDAEVAAAFAAQLEEHGIRCFVDSANIQAGQDWRSAIRQELSQCRELLFVASSRSVASDWVRAECCAAWGMGKRVTPVLVDVSADTLFEPIAGSQGIPMADFGQYIASIAKRRQRTIRFSGRGTELYVLDIRTAACEQIDEPKEYTIDSGLLELDTQTNKASMLKSLQYMESPGNAVSGWFQATGAIDGSFADMHYVVQPEQGRTPWSGITTLFTSPLNGVLRGYWITRSESSLNTQMFIGTYELVVTN